LAALPNATLVCTEKCRVILSQHFDISDWKILILAPGDSLSLGGKDLEFIQTPLAHWPESMFTYLRQDKILFSMDAFGQHYATTERFDDETPLAIAIEEAKTYYANILSPFGPPTTKALAAASKIEIDMIAPSHGIIWRSHVREILEEYRLWTTGALKPKVLVIYDTMWDSTEKMALAIGEGAACDGVDVELINVRKSDLTHIATEALDATAVAVGSPTVNAGIMPMMGAVLTHLQGLKMAGKAAFAFGSYGWGKGGAESVHMYLEAMKWELLREPLRSQYRPTPETLEECRVAGGLLAEKAKASIAAG
jgi:flavorubredoxin